MLKPLRFLSSKLRSTVPGTSLPTFSPNFVYSSNIKSFCVAEDLFPSKIFRNLIPKSNCGSNWIRIHKIDHKCGCVWWSAGISGNLASYFQSSLTGQTVWHYDFHKVGTYLPTGIQYRTVPTATVPYRTLRYRTVQSAVILYFRSKPKIHISYVKFTKFDLLLCRYHLHT